MLEVFKMIHLLIQNQLLIIYHINLQINYKYIKYIQNEIDKLQKENEEQLDYIQQLSFDKQNVENQNVELNNVLYYNIQKLINSQNDNGYYKKRIEELENVNNKLQLENNELLSNSKSYNQIELEKYKSILSLINVSVNLYLNNDEINLSQLNTLSNININNLNFICISDIIKKTDEYSNQIKNLMV